MDSVRGRSNISFRYSLAIQDSCGWGMDPKRMCVVFCYLSLGLLCVRAISGVGPRDKLFNCSVTAVHELKYRCRLQGLPCQLSGSKHAAVQASPPASVRGHVRSEPARFMMISDVSECCEIRESCDGAPIGIVLPPDRSQQEVAGGCKH